jgi:NAD(P)-dependent dehydrogenase (short-subunit alcohol dehydrogenase family)
MEGLVIDTVWYNVFKKELPDATGKVFVITGTTSGTGFVAARTAAELGGEVVLLNRPSDRSTKALSDLQTAVPSGKFVPIDCDLQSFDSVRTAATRIKEKYADSGIFCVCWNAGIMGTPNKATVDGYDTQMQTNHLSHFLLTAELFPLLDKYATQHGDARIVNHSSGGRHMTPNKCLERKYFEKNGGDLGGDELTGGFSGGPFLRYFQTKLANAVFSQALHQKLQQANNSNVMAICADPGMSATSLANHFPEEVAKGISSMAERMQTPEDGAMGIIKGMLGSKDTVESGKHYGPEGTKGPAVINPSKPYETDQSSIDMLWETSEAATGVTFVI